MKAEEAVQEWRRGLGFGSLRARIFAVNLLAVIVLAIMLLYLDTVRSRLLDERTASLANEAITVSRLVADVPEAMRAGSVTRLGMERGTRVRLYADDGTRLADNWQSPRNPRFVIEDPAAYGWRRASAKAIDRGLDAVLGFRTLSAYVEPAVDTASVWPELARSASAARPVTELRRASDGSLIVNAATQVPGVGTVLLTDSADDLADILRRERLTSAWLLLSVMALTLGLSLYLARTIVRPLRLLAIAAHRVRLGRSREVVVPRLPERKDEIGALARAISDMSTALRRQIDATEAFAADVAHELKNPLASLRSAVEVLERVEQPDLRAQLLGVIRDDVGRIDRLITDIADASRLDAELSRTGFQPIDIGALCDGLVAAYGISVPARGVTVVRRGASQPVLIEGDASRLAQVLRNLIDNAISFSPDGGEVALALQCAGAEVELLVSDQGPGVPPANRRDIFRRFYSERPAGEDFGRHSGLGLSIAGAIVAAHGGQIVVEDVPGGGALFRVVLPAA
ncbi:HAMP domain-containing histidine kinase [Sandarakinorhabdus sp. AAP62]|uniref:HAMP domain-containing histidine kinase n=1 Tax=Sandarakinorhabdus sp. AAP62 TaxID=1248916 RepID=UPI0002F360D0|nr:HAMP domain-containing histidine kinase [Sandarakinorhabdus sp. AAP62]